MVPIKKNSPVVTKILSPPISREPSSVIKINSNPMNKTTPSPLDKVNPSLVNKIDPPAVPKSVTLPTKVPSPPKVENIVLQNKEAIKKLSSPPKLEAKSDNVNKSIKEPDVCKDLQNKLQNLSLLNNGEDSAKSDLASDEIVNTEVLDNSDNNGVIDKIKKFEKAAENATGKLSRPGSVRGRSRTERLGSDSKDDMPPPATPFKDNVHFELSAGDKVEVQQNNAEPKMNANTPKWTKNDPEKKQKIIKPEFKPIQSPVDVTIRSPSLGGKIPDQFPSHGTAFRNVAPISDANRSNKTSEAAKSNEEMNTQNNAKSCKLKDKKYSISKGSSYFTRGSEEIWLVKKKDIEEIEERVLDSFRRAGGNVCMRSETVRPASDSGQAAFSHATMGRNKRQMYARSESLDPQWAGARSQTLKRQSSVACTCGHDKKTRAKSTTPVETTVRPRSRSHGDDNNQQHVLDKYETLV